MQSIIIPIMGAHLFYLPHVFWFGAAGDALKDEGQACPDDKSDREDIVLVEGRVKLHVFELESNDHVNFSVASVGGEGGDAELDNSH